jgi:hypothetical protein
MTAPTETELSVAKAIFEGGSNIEKGRRITWEIAMAGRTAQQTQREYVLLAKAAIAAYEAAQPKRTTLTVSKDKA